MHVGIGNAAGLVGRMNGKVGDHSAIHKFFLHESASQFDIFVQRKFVLQRDVKTVCELRFGMAFSGFYGVPERCSVTEALRSMSGQQNFRMENAALACVVADFVVIFAVQAFACAICCGSKDALSRASLDLRNGEMIQRHQFCSNDGMPRGSCAIWFSAANAKRMFSISSSSSSSVISRRMSCTAESAKMRSMTR